MDDRYSVEDVAIKLRVSHEQVRRWLRTGRLKGSMHSKREGYVIEETDLLLFVNENPKYSVYVTSPYMRRLEIQKLIMAYEAMQDLHKKRIAELDELIRELRKERESL